MKRILYSLLPCIGIVVAVISMIIFTPEKIGNMTRFLAYFGCAAGIIFFVMYRALKPIEKPSGFRRNSK